MNEILKNVHSVQVEQVLEGFELIGFETRNKYRIHSNTEKNILFAAELSTGFGGAILRQIFGHWRSFKVSIFDSNRKELYQLNFPFRWFFKTLHVSNSEGKIIGTLEQRIAFFRKKFDVKDSHGKTIAKINSSFFRFWTFAFLDLHGRETGRIQKKWSGVFSEMFTDKDNFEITFKDPALSEEHKILMLSTCLLVDIVYFEQKGKQSLLG